MTTAAQAPIPTRIDDPVNAAILAISEDRLDGFHDDPFGAIAEQAGLDVDAVIERVRVMLKAGVIRRVRQTLLSTSLAEGALVAWNVPPDRLNEAFDFMYEQDPFSGHVVIRSTDSVSQGSSYRLWTTLKVPHGYSLARHANWLQQQVGAVQFLLMPAKRLFVLGVGHTRRRAIPIGSKSEELAEAITTETVTLSPTEWRVLVPLKREFTVDEIRRDLWQQRADEAGLDLDAFLAVARSLHDRGVIGRFSTFLEHVKPSAENVRVTRYNALFHWAVPPGREIEAGQQVGRFHIMTHAYWREGGSEFRNVNIMGVAHGLDRDLLLEHKRAIDEHLESSGIPVGYTNVFWGGRSEIKPSEIAPAAYVEFCRARGLDPESMRET